MAQQGTGRPEAPRATWWTRMWQPFWSLPAVIAGASLVLAALLPEIDEAFDNPLPWVFKGGTEGARALLGTIAGAMISVTGLVFSITIVVLQLASSQFTPRILGTFLQSRVTQVTLGVFSGCFLYALTVLRAVREATDVPVPQTGVAVAYLYVVASVVAFLAFIHHITRSVQVSHVMRRVREEAAGVVDRLHVADDDARRPWVSPESGHRSELHFDGRSGYLTMVDSTRLVQVATTAGVEVDLTVGLGDFLAPHQPIGTLKRDAPSASADGGTEAADLHAQLVGCLGVARERSVRSDAGFGVRQLLDIAERALSPGVNDPTTAVQALNELHVLLRAMAQRPDPTEVLCEEDGRVRGRYRAQRFGEMVQQVVEEIGHYGHDSHRVLAHLEGVLQDLRDAARPEHRAAVADALARLSRHG